MVDNSCKSFSFNCNSIYKQQKTMLRFDSDRNLQVTTLSKCSFHYTRLPKWDSTPWNRVYSFHEAKINTV
jgi:hypothetical protein